MRSVAVASSTVTLHDLLLHVCELLCMHGKCVLNDLRPVVAATSTCLSLLQGLRHPSDHDRYIVYCQGRGNVGTQGQCPKTKQNL
jgi:hypothetical protein